MKKVTMFYLKNCPYCRQAFNMVEELKAKHDQYCDIEIELIEEQDEPYRTVGYDYWYVPTYFVEQEKLLEGVPNIAAVQHVFEVALED